MYTVKDKNGRSIHNTHDKRYAEHYANHIGGRVVKNPVGEFKRAPDSELNRKKLFKEYSNSPVSTVWCRETIQNSVDNKANNIRITTLDITSGPFSGHRYARIVDNGSGMSEDVVLNKFLVELGTDKEENEGIFSTKMGGFGKAKLAILIGWRAYRIITKRRGERKAIIVNNSTGGFAPYEYDFIDPPAEIQDCGTIIEILCWKDSPHKVDTCDARNFIGNCDLPIVRFSLMQGAALSGPLVEGRWEYDKVFDESLARYSTSDVTNQIKNIKSERNLVGRLEFGRAKASFEANIPANKEETSFKRAECAKLYYKRFTKAEKATAEYGLTSYIIYRVKGLYLWAEALDSRVNGTVIVDITVQSTKVLNDSRTAFRNRELRDSIEAWKQKLIVDPSLVLRGFSKERTILFEGSGSLHAPAKPEQLKAAQQLVNIQMSDQSHLKKEKEIEKIAEETAERVVAEAEQSQATSPVILNKDVAKEVIKYETKKLGEGATPETLKKAIERAVFIPEYVLHMEEDLAEENWKIPEKFKPEKLTKDIKKIIAVWAEMIRLAFMMRGSDMSFAIGFVFGENVIGLHAPKGAFRDENDRPIMGADGAILINPYAFDRVERRNLIDVNNSEHLEQMWATCVHEITHMIDRCEEHDEAFAGCLTRNLGQVARVYPLVEIIAEIVKTEEPLAKAKFAKGLDVEEYLSTTRRGRKPKSPREKSLEKYAVEIASQLAGMGKMPPTPDEFDIDIPDALWDAVRAAAGRNQVSKSTSTMQSDLMTKLLKAELAEALEKIAELQAAPEPKPQRKPANIQRLFKKYN